jgi:hypothetical protein
MSTILEKIGQIEAEVSWQFFHKSSHYKLSPMTRRICEICTYLSYLITHKSFKIINNFQFSILMIIVKLQELRLLIKFLLVVDGQNSEE